MSSQLLADLVSVFQSVWPTIAKSVHVSVGGGTSTLDPLILGNAVDKAGGVCPWTCGAVHVNEITGFSVAQFNGAAATLQARSCDATQLAIQMPKPGTAEAQAQGAGAKPLPDLVLTVPIVFSQLQVSGAVSGTVLGVGLSSQPLITFSDVDATLTIMLPLVRTPIAGQDGDAFIDLSATKGQLYVDVQRVKSITGAPGFSATLTNDAMQVGLNAVLSRLASQELTKLFENVIHNALGSARLMRVPALVLWLLQDEASKAAAAPIQACASPSQAWSLPCAPCDTCCQCATQGRCADDACAASCARCMPGECKQTVPASLVAAGSVSIVVVILVVALLIWALVGLAFGLVRGVQWAAKHARLKGTSKGPSTSMCTGPVSQVVLELVPMKAPPIAAVQPVVALKN